MICLYLWVVVQIVLESFPVSSSGHTQLLACICPVDLPHRIFTLFDYAVHLPTACIVFFFFRKEWQFPFRNIKRCWRPLLKIILFTATATVVTLIGHSLKSFLPVQMIPLPLGFFITMCSLLSLYICPEQPYERLSLKKLLCLSALQACALAPGISRFALTFVGARWLRLPARRAFEISFLIQWPLIVCASVYGIYVLKYDSYQLLNPLLVWVMLGSSIVAYAGMCLQAYMIQKKTMWRWGLYMFLPFILSVLLGSKICINF